MPSIPYDASSAALLHPEQRPTVFKAGDQPGDVALAIEAARLAYVQNHAVLVEAMGRVGYTGVKAFAEPGGGQGFGAMCGTKALLAFRGTQPNELLDIISDVKIRPFKLARGWVHTGFHDTAEGLWQNGVQGGVKSWLEKEAAGRTELIICGHSLGAAIATVLAQRAGARKLVTIGSPRVGDQVFVDALLATPGLEVTRIVDHRDVVTRMPPELDTLLLPYRHAGPPVRIGSQGEVLPAGSPPDDGEDDNLGIPAIISVLGRLSHFDIALPRDLTDHAPINYLRAFWP